MSRFQRLAIGVSIGLVLAVAGDIAYAMSRNAEGVPGPEGKLDADAQSTFGERYAGVSNNADKPTVYVKRQDGASAPSSFESVKVKPVDLSMLELRSAADRVEQAKPELDTRGAGISSWGPNPETNSVVVTFVANTDQARRTFTEVVGSGPYTFGESPMLHPA